MSLKHAPTRLLVLVAFGLGSVGGIVVGAFPTSMNEGLHEFLYTNVVMTPQYQRLAAWKRNRSVSVEGRWRQAPTEEGRDSNAAALMAIGYLDGYEEAGDLSGVVGYQPDLADNGLNLYVSGHAPEAMLMDMSGEVLHRWASTYTDAFPDISDLSNIDQAKRWRRVALQQDGSLLAIYEGFGIVKLDKESKVLWASNEGHHHDIEVTSDGTIWALARSSHVVERVHPYKEILEDYIIAHDQDGKEIRRISLLEAFEKSNYRSVVDAIPPFGDIFHTNTLEVMDGSKAHLSPLYNKGNFLISLRKTSTLAIVDGETGVVIWAALGPWRAQHQPTVIESGAMLLLDNVGHEGASKVIEYNPFNTQIEWGYYNGADTPFYTQTCGAAQRLSNGNTLITESDSGRAFEVTPEGDKVWSFYNPARAGKDKELVATLFEVIRLSPDDVPWLALPTPNASTTED